MADTGWISLSNITSNNSLGGTAAWINISNIAASDNNRADSSGRSGSVVMYAVWGHGMSFGIPSGATIDGIEVGLEGYRGNTSRYVGNSDTTIWLGRGSTTQVGTSYVITLSGTTESVQVVGSSSDTWMDMGWTAANIDDLYLVFQTAGVGTNWQAYIDHVKVKVYYTSTEVNASVSPVSATFSIPAIPASYVSQLYATVSPVSATWSSSLVSAYYGSTETASVSPVYAAWSPVGVSAEYEISAAASVTAVSCAWTLAATNADYEVAYVASVEPLTASWSAPGIAAIYVLSVSASVSPLAAVFSALTVSPVATAAFLLIWKDDGRSTVVDSLEGYCTVVDVLSDKATVANKTEGFVTVVDSVSGKATVTGLLEGFSQVGVARQ